MKVPRLFACERTAWAPPGTNALIHDYLEVAGYGTDDSGALFRPIKNNRGKTLDQALTPDAVYKLVKAYHGAGASRRSMSRDHHQLTPSRELLRFISEFA